MLALGAVVVSLGAGLPAPAIWTAGVTTLCAVWWVTEAIPIPATSLLPFALFPVAGVLAPKQLAAAYGHPLILLLLGGFLLSAAMERSGAHRKLAVKLVSAVGHGGGSRVVLAFMLTSAALSMWVSNSATTLMLLPVALAVIRDQPDTRLERPLLLGIAYAASIGGLGTPIGTPPNVVFMGVYQEQVGIEMTFVEWMKIGVVAVVVLLPIAWWVLTRKLDTEPIELDIEARDWQVQERRVLIVFAITALLWMTRKEPFGGWSRFFPSSSADDGTVALIAVCLLFILPDGRGSRMLEWSDAKRLPWGLLLLFAGGIAIAKAFDASGLSNALGNALAGFVHMPTFVMMLSIALVVTFLTEVTSNTAISTLLMPVLAATAVSANVDARLLMIPAALSASCAFMLPVATVPNAVVFGTERIPIRVMARTGFILNVLGAVALSLICTILL
jgi:sodium-dependent dicarboxylate transporter 2/3/5